MAGFKDAHMKRFITEKVGSQVAELCYTHGLKTHSPRVVAMLGASAKVVEHSVSRVHGNSTRAKEGNRLAAQLTQLAFELEHFFAEHCGEAPE